MSWKSQVVICPWGHAQNVQLPARLEAYGTPDPRAPILDGTLGRVRCEACGRPFRIEQQLTYFDHARGHWILMLPASTIRSWAGLEGTVPSLVTPALRRWQGRRSPEELRVRMVFGYDQLREKLLLWEAGLDDRLLEVVKLQSLYRPELGLATSSRYHLLLDRIDRAGRRLELLARRLDPPLDPERVPVDLDRYLEAQTDLELHRVSYPELFSAPFVSALRYMLPSRPAAARRVGESL